MTGEDAVLTTVRDRTLLVTLNRPHAKNAINRDLADGLISAVHELEQDSDLSVGVIEGAGDAFCAGMDLKAFLTEGLPENAMTFFRRGSTKPLVAAVHGFALAGGLEIALACDVIIAKEGTRLGIPEVGVGLFAAGGALLRLGRRVPYGMAMSLALTGDRIDAATALDAGLVDQVVDGSPTEAALQIAGRISSNAPIALKVTKELVQAAAGLSEAEFWDRQEPLFAEAFNSLDAVEGARAFAERRPPAWTGT